MTAAEGQVCIDIALLGQVSQGYLAQTVYHWSWDSKLQMRASTSYQSASSVVMGGHHHYLQLRVAHAVSSGLITNQLSISSSLFEGLCLLW
jgi:hypothetical protein